MERGESAPNPYAEKWSSFDNTFPNEQTVSHNQAVDKDGTVIMTEDEHKAKDGSEFYSYTLPEMKYAKFVLSKDHYREELDEYAKPIMQLAKRLRIR